MPVMKTKIRIWICHLSVMGFVLILTNNCTEDLNNTIIHIAKDQDSNSYSYVTIGTQVWMTHNLKARRYQNVNKIGTTTPATLDLTAEVTPKYQWAYDGDETNVDTYGRLYTWYAATDSRKICPAGWHVPTDEEWTELISMEAMGGEGVGGGKLKETGTIHWITPNTGATNETGFTALPGGYRDGDGTYYFVGTTGFWWNSTEEFSPLAYFWSMNFSNSGVVRINYIKQLGFSVRCLRD